MQLIWLPHSHFLEKVRENAERLSGGEGLNAQGCEAFGRACETAFQPACGPDLGTNVFDVECLLEVSARDRCRA